ncbi:MAG: ethanolamine utilization protein EutJ [Chloroflexi bacterium UTCFX4]|nr:MAG: ethanolamine utilization protein EutJ [Chloroflexi bacterium UTCFX4]
MTQAWNPELETRLDAVERALQTRRVEYRGRVHVGVDLGTAYTVVLVLDEHGQPLVGAYRFAQVVRDGLVVDFIGAIDLLKELKRDVETRLGFEITHAATGYPPGVPRAEVRATANVLRAAGLECTNEIDEPSAANAVLRIRDGAVVDVGGGTTGVAILREGQVVYTADEPTGGTQFSLVIAGALNISFEQAEKLKTDAAQQQRLFPLIEPVMEKVGTIVARQIARQQVNALYLVGGASMFPGMGVVIERVTGVKTIAPPKPLFITPLGIAMNDQS